MAMPVVKAAGFSITNDASGVDMDRERRPVVAGGGGVRNTQQRTTAHAHTQQGQPRIEGSEYTAHKLAWALRAGRRTHTDDVVTR